MTYVIFTIDFENNPHRMNVFKNYLLQCADEAKGNFVPTIGSYEGVLEHSYICRRDDFEQFIRGTIFVQGQESILHVASGNKMETHLEYLADGRTEGLGCMHQVCRAEALRAQSWTYRPDLDVYWIAREGNPDNAYRTSKALMDLANADATLLAAE